MLSIEQPQPIMTLPSLPSLTGDAKLNLSFPCYIPQFIPLLTNYDTSISGDTGGAPLLLVGTVVAGATLVHRPLDQGSRSGSGSGKWAGEGWVLFLQHWYTVPWFVGNHYLTQKKDEEEDFLRIKIRIAVTIYGFVWRPCTQRERHISCWANPGCRWSTQNTALSRQAPVHLSSLRGDKLLLKKQKEDEK